MTPIIFCRCSRHDIIDSRTLTAGRVVAVLAVVLAGGVLRSPVARAQAGQQKLSVEETTVRTSDGWRLPITYFRADDKDKAVVIMLHMKGENRLVWKRNRLAEALNKGGFAVITVDLRRHGEAKGPGGEGASEPSAADFQGMYKDLEAVKDFIFEEHQQQRLNMAKTAVIAPGMSAPVAMSWAALDWLKKPYNDAPTAAAATPRGQDVKAMVLLSPDDDLTGVPITRPLRELRQPFVKCAFFIAHSNNVSKDAAAAKEIQRQLNVGRGKEKTVELKGLNAAERGSDLINRGLGIEPQIAGFLIQHCQNLDIPWQDRRSRLERGL